MPLALRCSVIGTIIGALPGSGGTIASLLAYQHAENSTKNPEVPFGEGAIEGIVAPESSNNAAVAGAFIPMLTLGVPGDGITAIIMSALIVHGMNPGPLLMTKSPDVFYITCALLLIAGFLLLPFGLTGIKVFAKFVEIPKGRLFPMIVILGVTGAYVSNNLLLHIAWMMAFGIMGYLLKKYDFPASPLTLGIVMGSLLEDNWRNAFLTFNGVGGIVQSIFTRPITFILFLVVIWTLVNKTRSYLAAVAVIKGSFRKLFSGVKQ
jgi:putative tricarboxylic transport membrane protein